MSFDHQIVMTKIHLSLHRNMAQTTTTTHSLTIEILAINIQNKFNALQEISETLTLNDEYKSFTNNHVEVAAECILTKLRAKQSSLGDISS